MSGYETDIVLWSEHQAALLRRRAAGELLTTRTWTGRTLPRRSRPWAGGSDCLATSPPGFAVGPGCCRVGYQPSHPALLAAERRPPSCTERHGLGASDVHRCYWCTAPVRRKTACGTDRISCLSQ